MGWVTRGLVQRWEGDKSIDAVLADEERLTIKRFKKPKKVGKRAAPTEAKCGTAAGHTRHRRHKEKPCEACRNAFNKLQRDRYAEQRAALAAAKTAWQDEWAV